MRKNQRFLLAARPAGEIVAEDCALIDVDVPEVADGQVLLEIRHLALEPAMKGWMAEPVCIRGSGGAIG